MVPVLTSWLCLQNRSPVCALPTLSITNTLIRALRAPARGRLLSEPLVCSYCEHSLLGLHTSARLLGLGPARF